MDRPALLFPLLLSTLLGCKLFSNSTDDGSAKAEASAPAPAAAKPEKAK